MWSRLSLAALAAILWISSASAHGGGGGAVFVPMYFPPPSVPSADQVADISKIHTIAVLSAIGQHFTVSHVGAFTPTTTDVDITAWKLDDFVTARIRALLGSRFSVKDIPYDRTTLATFPNGQFSNSAPAVRAYLAALPKDGIDAFIVVQPDLEYQAPGVEGLGIETREDIFLKNGPPIAWANYEIDVIDASTLKTIGKAFSRAQLRAGETASFAGFVLGKAFAPTDDARLDDKQLAVLRILFAHFVDVSLVETLRALSLGVPLPSPGARNLVPMPADRAPFPAVKTIGVISAIGDEFQFQRIATILSETDVSIPIGDWNLDQKVQDELKASLSKRFAVTDAHLDRSMLAKLRLVDEDGKWRANVSELPASAEVDAYLIVVKHPVPLAVDMTGAGAGLWRNVLQGTTQVHAYYDIALVDARTLKILDASLGRMPPDVPQILPERPEDASLFPDKPPAATPGQLAQLKDDTDALLDASVPETLLDMLLTDSIPAYPGPATN